MIQEELITLDEDGIPTFSPVAKTIKEFLKLIQRDKGSKGDSQGRKKLQATKELSFIYLYCFMGSPYFDMEEPEKTVRIKLAVGLEDNWEVDNDIKSAMLRFTSDFNETLEYRYLEGAIIACNKNIEYYKNIDYSLVNSKGQPIYKIGEVTMALKNTVGVLVSLEETRNRAAKRLSMIADKTRGGHERNEDEDPEDDTFNYDR